MFDYLNHLSADWKSILFGIVVFASALILTRLVRWIIVRSFLKATQMFHADVTRLKFFKNAASFIIWMIALGIFVSQTPELKSLAVTLFAGAGILLAIIGFAAQEAFSTIVGGIFIVAFKPFRVGDMIKVGTLDYGLAEDITLRHTVILTFQNKRLIIPKSTISEDTIVNDNIIDTNICEYIEVGISYDRDLKLAIRIMQEEAEKHPSSFDNRTQAEVKDGLDAVEVRLLSFEDSSLLLRAYVWTKDPIFAKRMHSDINKAIKTRFDQEGIEIPFPYRTVVFKNDLENEKIKAKESNNL